MRRLPFLTNADRRALLLLECIIVLVILGLTLWGWKRPQGEPSADSALLLSDSLSASLPSKAKTYTYAVPEESVETFPFDPNTADSSTLLRLGLAPWQVRAIYRYRAKHGRYHTPEDFKRLPGMTYGLWERLGPCIRIAREYQYLQPEETKSSSRHAAPADSLSSPPESFDSSDSSRISSLSRTSSPSSPSSPSSSSSSPSDTIQRPVKFAPGTVVDLNEADTTMLKKIPGIASYRAGKIVEYRRKLGGFSHKEQVMEACQMPDEVLEWVTVKPVPLQRLDVNHLSLQRLMAHPYITFYQARAIVEYRNKFGPLSGSSDLQNLEGFTPQDIERMKDYLEFR